MINYEELERAAIVGFTESLEYDLMYREFTQETTHSKFAIEFDDEDCVAEALYAKYAGLSN